ncbi:Ni,Fe-hydrogenase I cytochrome b subunit [Desulfitobacterium dichloroeliminans LMG P-21439]|uniref:Ni,Fe-hydrogenase I cytochrome b subunit n=1 Tax=Desulfitobacterium dichloroeliminans (strain LMG P-21439 / DCA1) TaxID=871963 RepID=L0F652_DESDL|nr:cytochrome b/b6 domain-containing protein [Desulfitobacterium dichloroeliminans]AGA68121.1 Ni,Fe-hydrogenase I cytochrome b subunit [Desulfitobacterium dichloroeliminans LMG P-21439]
MNNKKHHASQPQLRTPVLKELRKGKLIDALIMGFPVTVRIFHWGFAFSLTGIILTGLILHQPLPFLALPYGKVFVVHVSFGWLASAFFVFRLVDMVLRKDKTLLLSWQDIKTIPSVFAYYFYLRQSLPPHGQYNPGQKMIFSSWFLLFPFLVFISLASYWAGERLDWVIKLLGGLQVLRMVKYTGAVYLTSTILLHVYLSVTQDLCNLQSMVTGYEQKKP